VEITLKADGGSYRIAVDPRTTLLDTLRERLVDTMRERLDIYCPKKGCDHGQCERAPSC
jgi:xanthine dehydrogenase YagT iron-sulfur-binding subunit